MQSEEEDLEILDIPILDRIGELSVLEPRSGIGLSGVTLHSGEDGKRMHLRIQLTEQAAMQTLGLLQQYAEEYQLEPPQGKPAKRPSSN